MQRFHTRSTDWFNCSSGKEAEDRIEREEKARSISFLWASIGSAVWSRLGHCWGWSWLPGSSAAQLQDSNLHHQTRSVIFLKQVPGLLRRCKTYFVFKGSVVALNSIPANEAEENKRFLASPPPLTGLLWLTVAVTNYSLLAVTRMYKASNSYLDLGF